MTLPDGARPGAVIARDADDGLLGADPSGNRLRLRA